MPRILQIEISDEEDAAAAEHSSPPNQFGPGNTVTVERVIDDRLADLVQSAIGVRAQKLTAKIALLKPEDLADILSLEAEKESLIAAEDAKIQTAVDQKLIAASDPKLVESAEAAVEAAGTDSSDPGFLSKTWDRLMTAVFGG